MSWDFATPKPRAGLGSISMSVRAAKPGQNQSHAIELRLGAAIVQAMQWKPGDRVVIGWGRDEHLGLALIKRVVQATPGALKLSGKGRVTEALAIKTTVVPDHLPAAHGAELCPGWDRSTEEEDAIEVRLPAWAVAREVPHDPVLPPVRTTSAGAEGEGRPGTNTREETRAVGGLRAALPADGVDATANSEPVLDRALPAAIDAGQRADPVNTDDPGQGRERTPGQGVTLPGGENPASQSELAQASGLATTGASAGVQGSAAMPPRPLPIAPKAEDRVDPPTAAAGAPHRSPVVDGANAASGRQSETAGETAARPVDLLKPWEPQQKELKRLFDLGMSNEQIARALGRTAGAVAVRLSKLKLVRPARAAEAPKGIDPKLAAAIGFLRAQGNRVEGRGDGFILNSMMLADAEGLLAHAEKIRDSLNGVAAE